MTQLLGVGRAAHSVHDPGLPAVRGPQRLNGPSPSPSPASGAPPAAPPPPKRCLHPPSTPALRSSPLLLRMGGELAAVLPQAPRPAAAWGAPLARKHLPFGCQKQQCRGEGGRQACGGPGAPLDELESGAPGRSGLSRELPSPSPPDLSSQVRWLQPAPLHTHFLTDLFTLPVCLLSSQ